MSWDVCFIFKNHLLNICLVTCKLSITQINDSWIWVKVKRQLRLMKWISEMSIDRSLKKQKTQNYNLMENITEVIRNQGRILWMQTKRCKAFQRWGQSQGQRRPSPPSPWAGFCFPLWKPSHLLHCLIFSDNYRIRLQTLNSACILGWLLQISRLTCLGTCHSLHPVSDSPPSQ